MAVEVIDLLEARRLATGPVEQTGDDRGLRHWRRSRDGEGIEWLLLDKEGTSTNTLDEQVLSELEGVLQELESDRPKGVVIRSAKTNGFVAGAEIGEFRRLRDRAAVEDRVRRGQAVLDRLERFPAPTIALIHGFCLGGGLELALACRYRIARDDAALGFPEVRLGLHPWLGGLERLPWLIGPVKAMPMMLTGKPVPAGKAKALGLVEPAVFDHVIESEATHCRLFSSPKRPVSTADHIAGLHVASLIRDGGTLQLGIGSIGDAVTYALKLRHEQNARFRELIAALAPPEARSSVPVEQDVFEQGLYGASEMFVGGFLELWRAGILRRRVYGDARLQALLNEGSIEEDVTSN